MRLSSNLLVFSFLPLVLGQYGPAPGPASSTTLVPAASPTAASAASGPSTQTVSVGQNNKLAFSPNSITAAVGSSIEFIFYAGIHSVAQSSFASPCAPLSNDTGFFSGAFNTASGTNTSVFTITVNDTNPIWFYCAFPSHCQLGMAGVVNPPSDGSSTLAEYVAAATNVSQQAAPAVIQGGTIGPAKAASAGSSTGSATSAATSASSAAARSAESQGGAQWVMLALTGVVAAAWAGVIMS